jgi:SRSO17 transposase
MTEQQVRDLGPAFAAYLRRFEPIFDPRSVGHLRDYCRGLLSDLPRKSVEPIALAAGVPVRTLQEFLKDYAWDHADARTELRRHVVEHLADVRDSLGTVGVLDETSCRKRGTKTPGVQRQYLGCLGKVDNGTVTVHVAVVRGRFKTLLDAELFLSEGWAADRARCREAAIPDDVGYRPKWQIALEQVRRAVAGGVTFDWLTFDEGYGDKPGLLAGLEADGRLYVGEVPATLSTEHGPAREVVPTLPVFAGARWRAYRVRHQTGPGAVWEVKEACLRLNRDGQLTERSYRVVVARNRADGVVKYFVSNAPESVPLGRLVRVAFRRWAVEHAFRLAKGEVGLTHYEGRSYTGLLRHLTLCLVVAGFVAMHADGLRGEKSGGDGRASASGAERGGGSAGAATPWHVRAGPRGGRDPVPPATQHGREPVAGTNVPHPQTARGLAL